MRGRALPTIAAVATCLMWAVAGCAGNWTWGTGLTEDGAKLPSTPNGVVIAIASNGFAVASARLSGALRDDFSEGITLIGGRLADEPLLPQWGVDWTGNVGVLHATVSATAAGPRIEVHLADLEVDATAAIPGVAGCGLGPEAGEATVTAGISMTTAKSGALQASVLSDVTWTANPPTLLIGDCGELFEGQAEVLDGVTADLLAGAAQNVLSALAPTLEALLPRLLGIHLGSRITLSVDDADATFEVKGPDGPSSNPWSYVDDQLFVFFSTAAGGKRHACVPPADPPAAAGLPVPSAGNDSSATLMVNESALIRAMHLSWAAGKVCGDRGTGALDLVVDDLANSWPEMAALEASSITARVWPEGSFESSLIDGVDGSAHLMVGSDALRVELYATVEDARVLATAFTIGLSVAGPLLVADDGSVWLDSEGVAVTSATAVTSGLVAPPSNIATVIGEPLARAVLNSQPVWQLPVLPAASGTVQTRRQGGYLIFAHPSVDATTPLP